MKKLSVVILAAGEGTRMKSDLPKVLHALSGKPLIKWVLNSVYNLRPAEVIAVVGHGAAQVQNELSGEKVSFAEQKKQLGSGHALAQTEKYLKNFSGDILVLCGDTPMISPVTLRELIRRHNSEKNAATVLSAEAPNPFGYGRIYRLPSGQVSGIIEEKDASPEQRKITEVNSGIYCFSCAGLWRGLKKITPQNKKHEYYLTDIISILNDLGLPVGAYKAHDFNELQGINTRIDLSRAAGLVRAKILDELMLSGVTIINPAHTYISPETQIGRDTVIYPGTIIEGKSVIGKNCFIGPNTFIKNSSVGDNSEIRSSFIDDSFVASKVKIGPFSNLRPGSKIMDGARVGNFSEIKNSFVGQDSKVNHLSYIGDATLGQKVNVGAGTITCNYDGFKKHATIIGDRVFVGSNVNLVAPVKVGHDVVLGAGSTITDEVPAKTLAIARARQVNRPRKNN